VREDGRQVGGKRWKERVYNRQEQNYVVPENSKESSQSEHANGMNEYLFSFIYILSTFHWRTSFNRWSINVTHNSQGGHP
jgi:hypothetical protein